MLSTQPFFEFAVGRASLVARCSRQNKEKPTVEQSAVGFFYALTDIGGFLVAAV